MHKENINNFLSCDGKILCQSDPATVPSCMANTGLGVAMKVLVALNNIYHQLTLRLHSIMCVCLIQSVKDLRREKLISQRRNSDSRLKEREFPDGPVVRTFTTVAWVRSLVAGGD